MKSKYESNIWKMYVIKGSRYFMLFMPIIVLFYFDNGLSMTDVFLLQAIFSIFIVIIEIPSGYIADIFGRKTTIIFATIFSFIGLVVYSVAIGFTGPPTPLTKYSRKINTIDQIPSK